MWENMHSDLCAQQKLKSSFASAQSVQSLCCLHEETLHPCISKMHPVKLLMRLQEYTGFSKSLLGSHLQGPVVQS